MEADILTRLRTEVGWAPNRYRCWSRCNGAMVSRQGLTDARTAAALFRDLNGSFACREETRQ